MRSSAAAVWLVFIVAIGNQAGADDETSIVSMRARAAGWLASRIGEDGGVRDEGGLSLHLTALAASALARSGIAEGDAAARARACLRRRQSPDGAIPVKETGPGATAATWLALGAFASSSAAEDREAAVRAREHLEHGSLADRALRIDRAGTDRDELRRAVGFLEAARTNVRSGPTPGWQQRGYADAEDMAALCGGIIDARRAHRDLQESLGIGSPIRMSVGMPLGGGELESIHVAARVLAGYRSPRLAGTGEAPVAWPSVLLDRLVKHWSPGEGAFSSAAGSPPGVLPTALAILALDAITPWMEVREAALFAEVAEEPARRADLSSDCAGCHRMLHPGLVLGWEKSGHARAGVSCADCHGTNHSESFRRNGKVSARTCGGCHAREAEEFAGSRHAAAWETLLGSRLFAATSGAAREACFGCHRVGESHADGARGSCNFCHEGHEFSARAAREPEACTGCHTGDDYPQDTAYWSSKHGAIYARGRDPEIAPTCATCHHPNGHHGDGFGIALGGVGAGAALQGETAPPGMRTIALQEHGAKRAEMISVCARCHTSRLAEESLRKADTLKREGTELLAAAASCLEDLEREGHFPQGAARDSRYVRPMAGAPGREPLEAFHEMWRFRYPQSWKGAYHGSDTIANWRSRAGLEASLDAIRSGADNLRSQRSSR